MGCGADIALVPWDGWVDGHLGGCSACSSTCFTRPKWWGSFPSSQPWLFRDGIHTGHCSTSHLPIQVRDAPCVVVPSVLRPSLPFRSIAARTRCREAARTCRTCLTCRRVFLDFGFGSFPYPPLLSHVHWPVMETGRGSCIPMHHGWSPLDSGRTSSRNRARKRRQASRRTPSRSPATTSTSLPHQDLCLLPP